MDAIQLNDQGVALLNSGQFQASLEMFTKATNLDPNYWNAWYNMGLAIESMGDMAKGLEYYDYVLSMYPSHSYSAVRKSFVLYTLGKHVENIQFCKSYLPLDANNTNVLNHLGLSLIYNKQYEEALGYYDKLAEIDPNLFVIYHNKAIAYNQLGKYQLAYDNGTKSLSLNPSFFETHYQLGILIF